MNNSPLAFIIAVTRRIRFKLGIDRKLFVLRYIKKNKSTNILEIGVFNGNFARRMISVAKKNYAYQPINYVGIDLFQNNFTLDTAKSEVSLTPKSIDYVKKYLIEAGVNVTLHEGRSELILPNLTGNKFDLIVIDGGHSYKTVKSDFENSINLLTEGGSIIFDDFTNNKGIIYGNFGINKLISEIDTTKFKVKVSRNRDFFLKSYGVLVLKMVRVSLIKK